MKLHCRCNHDLTLWEQRPGARARCPYCGRSYVVTESGRDRLKLRIEAPPPGSRPAQPVRTWEELGAEPRASLVAAASRRPGAALGREVPRESARYSWWHYLLGAWGYPLKGNAKWVLLMWAVLNVYVAPWFGFFPVLGLLAALAMLGILALYEFELIRQSAADPNQAACLPNDDDIYELACRPLGHLLAAVGTAALPLMIVEVVGRGWAMPEWWSSLGQACFLLTAFLLPANLLAAAIADDWRAVNPRYTVRAVVRIPGPYLICAAVCMAFYEASRWVAAALREVVGGMFLGPFLATLATVYLLSVAAHALGALHYCYGDRIGWAR